MSNDIEQDRITEIVKLHDEIIGYGRKALVRMIRLGELLTAQKAALPHGEWRRWMKQNLPFSPRAATNYMKIYAQRDRLKSANVADLTTAYKLLAAPRDTGGADEEVADSGGDDLDIDDAGSDVGEVKAVDVSAVHLSQKSPRKPMSKSQRRRIAIAFIREIAADFDLDDGVIEECCQEVEQLRRHIELAEESLAQLDDIPWDLRCSLKNMRVAQRNLAGLSRWADALRQLWEGGTR